MARRGNASAASSTRRSKGDPCQPGDGHAPSSDPDGWIYITCSGPPGCEGDPIDWSWGGADLYNVTWCPCEESVPPTPHPDVDPRYLEGVNVVPTTRWRWLGACDPALRCRDVVWERDRGWSWGEIEVGPVAPECTECELAFVGEDGACVHPSGVTLQGACCGCSLDDARDPEGRCLSPSGHFVASECCE